MRDLDAWPSMQWHWPYGLRRLAALMMPSEPMEPDQWAAANRTYPPTAAVPGPRDPLLTPYVVEPERVVASGRWRRVVLVFGAQTGKSEAMLDVAGQRLDQRPGPILYVGPNKQFLSEQFEPRVMALLDEAPTLMAKVARGKRMTKTRKVVAGVPFRLAHSGSSTALKSDPAVLALVDEYDEMRDNVNQQGGPLGLVERRGDTYADFVCVVTSTPKRGRVACDQGRGIGSVFLGCRRGRGHRKPDLATLAAGHAASLVLAVSALRELFRPALRPAALSAEGNAARSRARDLSRMPQLRRRDRGPAQGRDERARALRRAGADDRQGRHRSR